MAGMFGVSPSEVDAAEHDWRAAETYASVEGSGFDARSDMVVVGKRFDEVCMDVVEGWDGSRELQRGVVLPRWSCVVQVERRGEV